MKPDKQKAGFVRKGKALVFSTSGRETIGAALVSELLDECREEQAIRIGMRASRPPRGR